MPATLLSPDGSAARPALQVIQLRRFWNFRTAASGSPGKDAPVTQPELVDVDGGRSPREEVSVTALSLIRLLKDVWSDLPQAGPLVLLRV